jgi:hypothetical protein
MLLESERRVFFDHEFLCLREHRRLMEGVVSEGGGNGDSSKQHQEIRNDREQRERDHCQEYGSSDLARLCPDRRRAV